MVKEGELTTFYGAKCPTSCCYNRFEIDKKIFKLSKFDELEEKLNVLGIKLKIKDDKCYIVGYKI